MQPQRTSKVIPSIHEIDRVSWVRLSQQASNLQVAWTIVKVLDEQQGQKSQLTGLYAEAMCRIERSRRWFKMGRAFKRALCTLAAIGNRTLQVAFQTHQDDTVSNSVDPASMPQRSVRFTV